MTWRFHRGQGVTYFYGSRSHLIAISPSFYVPLTNDPLSVSSQYTLWVWFIFCIEHEGEHGWGKPSHYYTTVGRPIRV